MATRALHRPGDRLLLMGGSLLLGVCFALSWLLGVRELSYPSVFSGLFAVSLFASVVVAFLHNRHPRMRLLFVGTTLLGMGELCGVTLAHTEVELVMLLSGSVGVALNVLFFIGFPFELPTERRRSPLWAALAGLLDGVPRTLSYLGSAPGGVSAQEWVLIGDGVVGVIFLGLLISNSWYAPPQGRRRVRWIVMGVVCAYAPWLILAALSWPPELIKVLEHVASLALPASLVLAIVADDAFEVNGETRLSIALGLSALVGVVALQAALVWGTGPLVQLAPSLSTASAQMILLTLGLGLGALVGRWLHEVLQRAFVPEQGIGPSDFKRFCERLDRVETPDAALRLLGDEVRGCFRPTRLVLYRRDGLRLLPEAGDAPAFDLLPGLQQDPSPVREGGPGSQASRSDASPSEQLTLTLRPRGDVMGALVLGPKGSGSPYSDADRERLRVMVELTTAAQLRVSSGRGEEALVKLLRDVRASERARSSHTERHLAATSHDMKQPVEAIRLMSELLAAQTQQAPHLKRLADEIREAAGSLREVLMDSLDGLSRHQTLLAERMRPLPLRELEARLRARFQRLAAQKPLDLSIALGPHTVHTDPLLFERILANLISNAIRYTPPGGRVRVTTRSSPLGVTVQVQDTGVGIDPEEQERALGVFQQLDGGSPDGHGLGLAIVVELCALLGHRFALESQPGQGTVVSLSLAPGRAERALDPDEQGLTQKG